MDSSLHDKGSYGFGPFLLDPRRRILTRDGAPVSITPKVFELLLYLVENPDRIVTKPELLSAVWPDRIVSDASLSQTVFVLRRTLGGEEGEEQFIVTAPGRGYRFTAQVRRELGAPAPEPPGPAPAAEIPAPIRSWPALWRSLPAWWAAGLGLFLLAAAAAAVLFATSPWRPVPIPSGHNLLVLTEFQNLTGEPIFDKTLGKALEIDLDQSPFLTVLPDQKVQDTLALMTRSRDEPLTPALAEEVCARNNGRAVLAGAIAPIGAQYLLTITATDCTGAEVLAAEKVQVDRREALIAALDGLGARLRQKLGESSASIQRFGAPLLPERTASLEALKAFSEATWLNDHGRRAESIPLFEHAIELDPKFAAAYASLSFIYYAKMQDSLDAPNIAKAYALRDTVGERDRFNIVARYNQSVTKDLDAALVNLQLWTNTYPNDPAPWTILATVDMRLGRNQQAIAAAKRALALDPEKEVVYDALARAYLHAHDLDQSKAVCLLAMSKGLAGDDTHVLLLRLALARGEKALIDQEVAYARGKPLEQASLAVVGIDALSRGQARRGEDLVIRAIDLAKTEPSRNLDRSGLARLLVDFGLADRARARLRELPAGFVSPDYLITEAEVGDDALVEPILEREVRRSPTDTVLNKVFAPEARAALALRHGRPREAVTALSPAAPFDQGSPPDVPYMRGVADLAAGNGVQAIQEFRAIVGQDESHPAYPTYPLVPLARLGLARAYRLTGDLRAARWCYQAFFADWKDADPDLPVLLAAKAEYAALQASPKPLTPS